jgi:type IV pilus assembly protein PilA
MFNKHTNKKGFTLLEILLVVAAMAILAGIVILAINPTKQLGETRNAQRRIDVQTILNAVYQYALDNRGSLPSTITSTSTEICQTSAATCTSYIDLSVLSTSSKYVVSLPSDPSNSTTNGTGYFISKTQFNRVTVTAPSAEQGATISVTR